MYDHYDMPEITDEQASYIHHLDRSQKCKCDHGDIEEIDHLDIEEASDMIQAYLQCAETGCQNGHNPLESWYGEFGSPLMEGLEIRVPEPANEEPVSAYDKPFVHPWDEPGKLYAPDPF